MIFADKLIALRKKSGWSQEELAEQMAVTRQSVSKWEGAQAVPDLEKIVRLSQLFGVSTDYLLKDELELPEAIGPDRESVLRRVTLEEAGRFLALRARAAKAIAWGVFLCILSPICLFFMAALTDTPDPVLPENAAMAIGLSVLLVLVAAAAALFILTGSRQTPYQFLEEEDFETEYGVSGMVRERQAQYRPTYIRNNILGSVLCILAAVPLFWSSLLDEEQAVVAVISALALTMLLVGVGVVFFLRAGVVWASFEKLLQEGDYAPEKKSLGRIARPLSTVYWLAATAGFLTYSFLTDDWNHSWIIMAAAGVLYPALLALIRLLHGKQAGK